MAIHLKPEHEQFVEQKARELGYQDAAAYVADLIQREQHKAPGYQTETTQQWLGSFENPTCRISVIRREVGNPACLLDCSQALMAAAAGRLDGNDGIEGL